MLSELLIFMGDSDSLKNLMKAKGYLRKMGIYKKKIQVLDKTV